jgi:hypothetical protein
MYDEDNSVSIAVNRKQVHSSGHCGMVSREMLVMCGARALGKLRGCSKEASWDKVSRGACKCACWGSKTKRCRLGSKEGFGDKARGWQTGMRGLDGVY